ncbi:TIGR02611 family protein [Streptomyces albus subsp. chlorinus]|uniref:TIGR02611 family protein n=1 Tax=Streptomyces albus TaxID=1888 RepID=UPI001D217553|nr:TIGR02611 family protein [Streptomyces albus]NSC20624.1 TIGR02611 family protein [Streptomyces albus subsp. chlorinus]
MSAESDEMPLATREEKPLGSRAPNFIQASRPLHLSWRVGIFLVGLAIVVAGVIMLPLPGPGWLVIFGGMAVWATEFVWAQHVLRWTKRKYHEGTEWLKERRAARKERKAAKTAGREAGRTP